MRCMGASARFSAPLSRARSPVNARAWRGQGSDDVSRSRAKLVFCLGSQILNFHSRAFLRTTFFLIRKAPYGIYMVYIYITLKVCKKYAERMQR